MKISSGTLFRVKEKIALEKNRTDVVVDIGEEDSFSVARTFYVDGEIAFFPKWG